MKGKRNARAADVAVLSDSGTVELVGTTATGRSADGVSVGAPASSLRATAGLAGDGLRVRRAGRVAWVYAVRDGRVRAVAVASSSLARRPAALRAAIARLRAAKATNATPEYVPGEAETATRGALAGRSLAGSSDPRLNAALALLCHLQVQAP